MSNLIPGNSLSSVDPDAGFSGTVSKGDLSRMIGQGGDEKALKKASKEFAGVFVGQMLKVMQSTVEKCEIGHGGKGEEIFQDMLNDEFARTIAYSDNYGISNLVYKSLKQRSAAAAAYAK